MKEKCPACFGPVGLDCDDPRKLLGQPIGQYHCPGCGVMQVAGIRHINCDFCGGTGMTPIEIHTTDRAIFKSCRLRWHFSSPLRLNLEPVKSKPALSFGTAYHAGLAAYYSPANIGREIGPAVDAFQAALNDWRASIPESKWNEEDDQQYREQSILGIGMLNHYHRWAQAEDNFDVVWVEKEYTIPIKVPGFDGEVIYSFKPDGLAVDRTTKKAWLLEHKTSAKSQENTDYLLLDDQCGSYLWGIEEAEGIRIEGVIYTMHRKKIPTPLTRLKRGGGFSVNKAQDTTREVALAELEREYGVGNVPHAYDEFLQHLYSKGNTFFQRDRVRRTPHEIQVVGESIIHEVADMVNDPYIYRNATRWNCSNCAFVAPCIGTYEKIDVGIILEGNYRKRDGSELAARMRGEVPNG